jgi:hypothetical protein
MPHKNIQQKRARELGAGRLSFLLTIALAAVFVYLSEANARAQLHEKAREYGLPEGYNIDLKREGKVMTAIITYTRKVRIPFERDWPVRIEVKDLGF